MATGILTKTLFWKNRQEMYKQIYEVKNMSHRCIVCNEGITNPICPECLGRELEQWLHENGMDYPIWPPKRTKRNDPKTRCIICGNDMELCAHCFTSDVYEAVLEKRPELKEDYLRSFDYFHS